jgi:hypothetical protein
MVSKEGKKKRRANSVLPGSRVLCAHVLMELAAGLEQQTPDDRDA